VESNGLALFSPPPNFAGPKAHHYIAGIVGLLLIYGFVRAFITG
jgi:hypothetical protein